MSDNFNIQEFVQKTRNDTLEAANKQALKAKRKIIKENHQSLDTEVADMIEGLLHIRLKEEFLRAFSNLYRELLEDDNIFDSEDIVSHLANEMQNMIDMDSSTQMMSETKPKKPYPDDDLEDRMDDGDYGVTLAEEVEGGDAEKGYGIIEYASDMIHDEGIEIPVLLVSMEEDGITAADVKASWEADWDHDEWTGGQIKQIETLISRAAKKLTENEEEDIDIDIADDVIADESAMEAPTEKKDSKEIFSKLVDAYEAAKTLGDDKLTRQLANTITYFNKSVIFGNI